MPSHDVAALAFPQARSERRPAKSWEPNVPALMQYDDRTRVVFFPAAMGKHEPMADYRYALGVAMRRWVLTTLYEHGDYATITEQEALQVCDRQGRLLVNGLLHDNELRLMTEAIRDVVNVREAKAKSAEWFANQQASHVAEVASND